MRTTGGIERLRSERGKEKITFNDVVDHLVDFVDRYPECADVVDGVAHFLAEVEEVDHDHERDEGGGIKPGETVEV